ncbi:non-ribosomal peptide synthetase [Paenibacillus typhae]|uniref:Amino acid adenylation domain-containing protein n=1 Tax=Paenibacillus typhae TaxID=1174501 RepID=A0A1G8IDG1_9BACL|nr:non-ribosomal peptide synthetase [Paenibacillus typhae]SDI16837.1 amino acid adenylation domain-containing protein [Paenibacillus typhae]
MNNILSSLVGNMQTFRDKTAITESSRSITYGGLNALSNVYLRQLQKQGIQAHDVVAIELERSIEAIAAMVAVLKAGAAYTVINKDYPDSRKQTMRSTIQVKATINEVLQPDPLLEDIWDFPARSAEQLCYIVFTSGTTSTPKAVGIPDRGVLRLLGDERLGLSPEKTISHISPLEFDASIIEIWGGLLSGMTISLLSKTEILNIYHVEKRISQGIDVMWITCSLFNFWVDKKPEMFRSLSRVIVGGEQLSLSHVNEVLKYTTVVNGYGPTENTVFTTLDVMEQGSVMKEIAIGTPVHGTQTFIVNESGESAVEGELYAGGQGVAIGYLGNPEKTNEAFIRWQGRDVYKTGDLVRLNEEGKIVYLGRKDTQVKINGYRIDLQEIEYTVRAQGIRNCHAFVREKKIYLAITTRSEQLGQVLKQLLPMYMLPSRIVYVQEIPLTANGKTDTRALYEQHFLSKNKKLAQILQQYLPGAALNEQTNIFEQGIDSVTVWEIAREINQRFNADISFFDVFEHPSIEQLSNMLGEEHYAANYL